ncbi:Pycsar system effector family protein [Mesobacillus jeotgali]|uniref:Pycsar system effector family protein n=1 Tax=Mesobacillus jeotgali TaxID=129985 RepID=UPI00177EE5B5|nr:Pycsar system effector family protein [Mesobacillus jeotgali]UYZ19944.1 DUF5706 domain-containing protein [Mesobacillus jeotgali]
MDKREMIFENFKNIQDLIKFIDQKAGALLVLYGFLLTAFIEFSKKLSFVNINEITGLNEKILSFLTLITGLALVLFITYQFYIIIVLILKPRTAKHYQTGESSLFYYYHISKIGKEQLIDQYKSMDEDALTVNLLGQVFEVSKILDKKTVYFAKTTNHLLLTGIILLFFILLSYIV